MTEGTAWGGSRDEGSLDQGDACVLKRTPPDMVVCTAPVGVSGEAYDAGGGQARGEGGLWVDW